MKKIMLLLTALVALSACQAANESDNNIIESLEPAASEAQPDIKIIENLKPFTSKARSNNKIVEIKEKMFIAQTNEIYYNYEDYLGKTIKYEGIFKVEEYGPKTKYYAVIRYGPGCCGTDLNAGFYVKWNKKYPNPNDWVEAVGVLESHIDNAGEYLCLALTSLKVLPKRGAETVFR